jgi:hypothetical protein
MSQQLINRSPDLKRLRDEGYEVDIFDGYLIIHSIPYVNAQQEVKFGKFICPLCLNNDITVKPNNHVMGFMGEYPSNKDGSAITAIMHSSPNQKISENLIMNHTFSNKPPNGYINYYEKVKRYAEIITAPAISINPSVTAKTFKAIETKDPSSVFKYIDTNSSRANITILNNKFNCQEIGIIGLGGTGSYILDMVSKTPVKSIRLFDGDVFLQHNAFRSPGAPEIDIFNKKIKKTDYFKSIYSNMHNNIISNPVFVTEENISLLKDLSYVFICVDKSSVRNLIISNLIQFGIAFLDVGLGLSIANDNLVGTIRLTSGTQSFHEHISKHIGSVDIEDDNYATNIQIADLNAFNALLAVIKWKKLSGFYQDLKNEHHTTYTINTSQLLHDDFKI